MCLARRLECGAGECECERPRLECACCGAAATCRSPCRLHAALLPPPTVPDPFPPLPSYNCLVAYNTAVDVAKGYPREEGSTQWDRGSHVLEVLFSPQTCDGERPVGPANLRLVRCAQGASDWIWPCKQERTPRAPPERVHPSRPRSPAAEDVPICRRYRNLGGWGPILVPTDTNPNVVLVPCKNVYILNNVRGTSVRDGAGRGGLQACACACLCACPGFQVF